MDDNTLLLEFENEDKYELNTSKINKSNRGVIDMADIIIENELKYNFENASNLVVIKEFICRDGKVEVGTKAYLDEISEDEYTSDGVSKPHKICFESCVENPNADLYDERVEGGSDWFSEEDIDKYFKSEGIGVIRTMDERKQIYDELCALLTEYEDSANDITKEEMYDMLVKIQNNWETVITAV